jgi:hypothetical protein
MGNTQSRPQNETRRSNRLSKPLSKRFNTFQTSQNLRSDSNSSQASGLIGWQNPWVGYNISNTPVENRISYPKKAEIPPTLFEADSSEESPIDDHVTPTDDQPVDKHQDRPSLLTIGSRRASYQPGTPDASSQFSPVYEQPRRANSIQTPLQRQNSEVYENKDATSSNTHFLVGNQRFSLTRRRSLLTRPGVATRRTTGAIQRVPSPIGEPIDDPSESAVLQWPLPSDQRLRLPSPARPTSPTDARYTQLGALKLGSLRVVNGSASPCPSERVPLDGPGLGLKNLEVVGPLRGSTLEIPALPDLMKNPDDAPGSPFSFEKSPTITVRARNKSLFPEDPDDEAFALCDDMRIQLEKGAMDGLTRSTSRSLNKSDSGYSSATSVHSIQRSRTRGSIDSQTSGSCGAESTKNVWISNLSASTQTGDSMQRHLSLEGKSENYSRLIPASHRWYDSSNPTPTVQTRSRRSTLCAPRYTEYSSSYETNLNARPTVETSCLSMPQSQQAFTRGPVDGGRLSAGMLDVISVTGSSTKVELTSSHQETTVRNKERLRRSASAYHIHENDAFSGRRSRSKSQGGSRIWSLRPGVEAPPLPTILSAGFLRDDIDTEFPDSEPIRGRPRSRSHDYRRCRLTKSRPQPDVPITISPFALY